MLVEAGLENQSVKEKKGQGDVVASFERCRGRQRCSVRGDGGKKSECSQETAKEEEKIQ